MKKSSRQRYRGFVQDYQQRRLDELTEARGNKKQLDDPTKAENATPSDATPSRAKRRQYLHEYVRWLWPHRYAVGGVFLLALSGAGLQMIEPLFMRFIIDRVLLNTTLDSASRVSSLNLAGGVFLAVIMLTSLIGVFKDYRQRLLNVRVMLSLRRSLFDRLLHLPLPKLWDMKTGGILVSRRSGGPT